MDELAAPAGPVPLRPGEVHVWYVDLDGPPPAGSDAAACLDTAERARADRFVRDVDRRRFRAAHCALRHLLAGYLDCPAAAVVFSRRCPHCGHPDHGKPTAGGPAGGSPVDHNLSHSDGLGAVAVARRPLQVGLDVERRRPNVDWAGILSVVGGRARAAGTPEAGPDRADGAAGGADGFEQWTRLEAVGKAAGTGIIRTPTLGPPDAAGWLPAELTPTEPAPTEPAPTEPAPTEPAPGEPMPGGGGEHRPAGPTTWWVRTLDPPEGYAAALAVSEVPAGIRLRWHR